MTSRQTDQVATYVLDTCVLLADPQSPLRFDEHDVVLPMVVVEELDRKKTRMDEVGGNARAAIRLLEELGASRTGGLREAVELPGGGTLRIELNGVVSERLPAVLDPHTPDHRILATCLNLHEQSPAVLVTKDASLRIKGAQLGVPVQDYRADTVPVEQLQSGLVEYATDGDTIDRLFQEGKITLDEIDAIVNQFVLLRSGASRSALARVIQAEPTVVVERVPTHVRAFGVEPKNVRQTVALHQLLDPDIPAVSLMGMAGTGKTFLARPLPSNRSSNRGDTGGSRSIAPWSQWAARKSATCPGISTRSWRRGWRRYMTTSSPSSPTPVSTAPSTPSRSSSTVGSWRWRR